MTAKKSGFKILIADDHPAILIGLRNILEGRKLKSILEARDGAQALEMILAHKPDLAILDLFMPNLTGIEVLKDLFQKKCSTKVVIFSAHVEKDALDEALKYGAKGYLLKDNTSEELLNCVNFVLEGGIYLSPSVTDKLLRRRREDSDGDESLLRYLSEMEKGILLLLANNMTSKQIADKLKLSFRTVQNHRANICSKLNLNGVNSLLIFALQHKAALES